MSTLLKRKGIEAKDLLRDERPEPITELTSQPVSDDLGEIDGEPAGRLVPRRWTAALLIFATALLVVLFVANSIRVNELLVEIDSVERERDAVKEVNHRMRSQLLDLTSVDRITRAAAQQGLRLPDSPPQPIVVRERSRGEQ